METPSAQPTKDATRWRQRASRSAAALLLLGLAHPVAAHNLAPAYLELRELPRGGVAVQWKLPATAPRGAHIAPVLPCPAASAATASADGAAVVLRWRLACRRSLVGQRVAVAGLAGSGTDALLRVELADGRSLRAVLSASAPALSVPARESVSGVLTSYARLGVEHLWTGLDHLLFIAGLTLLLGATRRLALAISAFTAGHSVTLALAALGLVSVPQAVVELAIAATIVALALSLARERAGSAAAAGIARRPALLPFTFGLLHGLGFAAALGALGLPQGSIPLALFAFNLGIELGQLALVAALLTLAAALLRARALALATPRRAALAHEAAATAIGSLGVFWCLDRAAGWLLP